MSNCNREKMHLKDRNSENIFVIFIINGDQEKSKLSL